MDKKLYRRMLCLLLALQLLCAPIVTARAEESLPLEPAQEQAEPLAAAAAPYKGVFFSGGYAPYAQKADNEYLRYNVEGESSKAGYTTWADDETEFRLDTLPTESKYDGPFSVTPSGRVPDRQFQGWVLYEGPKTEARYFLDDPSYLTQVPTNETLDKYELPEYFKVLNTLPLIGRWALSGNAAARKEVAAFVPDGSATTYYTGFYPVTTGGTVDPTAPPLQLYSGDIAGKAQTELAALETDFDPEIKDYYLRVPAQAEAVDLSIIAAEPFAFEGGTDPMGDVTKHVTVTAQFGKKTIQVPTLTAERLNDGIPSETEGVWQVKNDEDHPASSRFTILGYDATGGGSIQLFPSAGDDGTLYNKITVRITAPNGINVNIYTFYIQRLADPMLTTEPGNTPMGMIMRDPFPKLGGALPAERRARAENYFKENKRFESGEGMICYPMDPINNAGYLNKRTYQAAAWNAPAPNPDLDPKALVAYQNSTFTEPGITLTDSEGRTVGLAEPGHGLDRRVLLRRVANLDGSAISDGAGTQVVYKSGKLEETTDVDSAFEAVADSEGRTMFDLRGEKIRPGIYQIEYRFTDPASGLVFDADADTFYKEENAPAFTRTLIVLPIPGDVDMDGAVTVADAMALRRAVEGNEAFLQAAADATAKLFAYRVCDIDGDGIIAIADADMLLAGNFPQLLGKTGSAQYSDYYYQPLPGEERPQREAFPPTAEDETKVGVTLEYLGKNEGAQGEAIRSADATVESIERCRIASETEKLELDDVFWVGVRLSGMKKAAGTDLAATLDGFTVTLGYDASLVQPVVDLTDLTAASTQINRGKWAELITEYNIGASDKPPSEGLLWGGPYQLAAASNLDIQDPLAALSVGGILNQVDASKGISGLETAAGSQYRELTVSLSHPNADQRRALSTTVDSAYVLRVPFRLTHHPHNAKTVSALDLSLGMRQLTFYTESGTASAWSTYPIFGGKTTNLNHTQSGILEYRGGSALSRPLGKDKTEYTVLKNELNGSKTVYGEPFACTLAQGTLPQEDIPAGLSYDGTTGRLTGMPTRAGTFSFYAGETPYELTVEKAPLTLTVNPQARYYGEENPNFTFDYNPKQIKTPDLAGGANYAPGFTTADTKGTMLIKMKGWTESDCAFPMVEPVAAIVDGKPNDKDVEPGTPAGEYSIIISKGINQNYALAYSRTNTEVLFDDWGNGIMRIKPRPVYVEKINQVVGPLLNSGKQSVLKNQSAYLSDEKAEFTLLPGTAVAAEDKLQLTGPARFGSDVLRIAYSAEYQFDTEKGDKPPDFNLVNSQESRNVLVRDEALATDVDTANKNYVLVAPRIKDKKTEGLVVNWPVVQLELVNPYMKYTTGDRLILSDMSVAVTYQMGEETKREVVPYQSAKEFANRGLHIGWVSAPGHTPIDDAEHTLSELTEMKAATHNGKYLCIWVQNPGDEHGGAGTVVACYSATLPGVEPAAGGPFSVAKATVYLRPEAKARYYGEKNPDPTFTYNLEQLAPGDRVGRAGKGADLVGLAGYTPPTMEAVTKTEQGVPVTAATEIGGDYRITIKGAASDNYDFQYYRLSSEERDPELGFSELKIYPRPIVVQQVTMSTDTVPSDYFLYDDTKDPVLAAMYTTTDGAAVVTTPTATTKNTDHDRFTAALPAGGVYYPAKGSNDPIKLKYTLSNPDAIYPGDEVALTYLGEYKADRPAHPYFQLTAGNASEPREVAVRDMALTETGKSKNYVLVYSTNADGIDQKPIFASATKGPVKLRPIRAMEVSAPPTSLQYTYGDVLALGGMTLKLTYEMDGDNAPTLNNSVRTLPYSEERVNGVVTDTSFWKLGLRLYWAEDGTTKGDEAVPGAYIDVAKNSGRRLLVYGRRNGDHKEISAAMKPEHVYSVGKKKLPLTVAPQYRYYGEPNGTYTFTFSLGDLAEQDKSKVYSLPLSGTAAATGTAADSAALTALGGYTGPRFTTNAAAGSNVQAAAYALTLREGALDNYDFTYQDAGIRVFRRPITVQKIIKNPVTTIFRDTPETDFRVNASSAADFTAKLPVADGSVCKDKADRDYMDAVNKGMREELKLTGGALYGGAEVKLTVGVKFKAVKDRPPLSGSSTKADTVTVTDIALSNTQGIQNYILVKEAGSDGAAAATDKPADPAATGELDMRNIKDIKVTKIPNLSYTYGEPLDLSDLRIIITYETLVDAGGQETTPPPDTVGIGERGGIYVNYWPNDTVGQLNKEQRAAVVSDNRPAASGDHLTRAPVHDAGKYKNEQATNDFAHNGKYLIVSAIQHSDYGYVQPVVVQGPLAIAPLDLTYTLSAESKIYDGDPEAAGALTLTNPYDRDETTDVVYAVTGAEYENDKPYHKDPNTAFADYVKDQGYAFPIGEHSTEGRLKFTFLDENVKYADDRHTTENPVPAHDDYWAAPNRDERHDAYGEIASLPVEVTQMNLGGPDAANYKLDEHVDRTTNVDSPAKATVPFATIEKKTRTLPTVVPTLGIDRHTNAAMVTFGQELNTINDPNDDFKNETHFEYTLVYNKQTGTVESPAFTATHWAGEDGLAPRGYQDGVFFGGEAVQSLWPDGYEPEREEEHKELKEDDVVQGQIYRWAKEDTGFVPVAGNGCWEGYTMYTTNRAALPRDQVFWSMARVSETHNYLPSDPITSSTEENRARDIAAAKAVAEAEAERLTDKDYRPEKDENLDPPPIPAAAAKTYFQRLDLISDQESRGKDAVSYPIATLESVWFTDVVSYEKQELLGNVVRNSDPTRYYGYFWDADRSAALDFKEPLDLSKPFDVEIKEKQEGGGTQETTITVNENQTAVLHVSTTNPSGGTYETSIAIDGGDLNVPLGAQPVTLSVTFTPKYTTVKTIRWTSSNEAVATVDKAGLVTFLGLGSTVITATSKRGKSDTITVTVQDPARFLDPAGSILDLGYSGSFFTLDEAKCFYPDRGMTRGELMILLAQFYKENAAWTGHGTGEFPDLSGNEPYAEAAKLLGKLGVVSGVEDGKLAANQVATRAEMAAMLARMLFGTMESTLGKPHAFRDAGEEDTWAYSQIDRLARYGIVFGTGDGCFDPGGVLTRGAAVAFLARLLPQSVEIADIRNIPADVSKDHWAYESVLRATNEPPKGKTKK